MTTMAGYLTNLCRVGAPIWLWALTGCVFGDETVSGYADREAVWQLKEIGGIAFDASASLQFPEKGQISGSGPCNSFTAIQTVPYPWLNVQALAATRKACVDLDDEQQFFSALQAMTLAEVSGDIYCSVIGQALLNGRALPLRTC